ncbi:hypothetical protein QO231_06170 [Sedimentitalea todarodis]|uniref:Core-binding (CB) domain-containing protein n=1 Tax=Sedimentitalea todarodis TaxID=1631240 RepID=A0ABU3VBA1_9RHOB|nr:hypothetical protein [Sedimentitalea todarodis]
MAQVLERYRDTITSTKRCADNERYAINGFLRSNLAPVRLDKVTPARVAKYRDLRLEDVKPATVVRELGWLQHAIDIACSDWGQHLPDGNPARQVRRPKIDNRRERRLQQGEWQALLDAVSDQRTPLLKPLLRLMEAQRTDDEVYFPSDSARDVRHEPVVIERTDEATETDNDAGINKLETDA